MSTHARRAAILSASSLCTLFASAAPSIPGVGIHTYGTFPSTYLPVTLTRGTDGSLYAGTNDNATSGAFVRRIPPGGGTSVQFSIGMVYDPDGVLFDATGAISGVANSVLLACSDLIGGLGIIDALRPDGTRFHVVGPLQSLDNNDAMAFNSQNVLHVNVFPNHNIVRLSGLSPVVAVTLPPSAGGSSLAFDELDRLWIACADSAVRRYDSNDTLQATIPIGTSADPSVVYCPGGAMPKGIYVINNQSGTLSRINEADQLVPVGNGFPRVYAITSDPAGNLYFAGYNTGEVFRTGCPADLNGDGLVDDSDFTLFAAGYNLLDCADPAMPQLCPGDINRDALVDDADFVVFVAAYNDLICE
ncbi:MAG: hypothetical protein U0573_08345 [Phycisphaerales bacterium]|nr:hypothetical protein [Planctomycetota bacterium]